MSLTSTRDGEREVKRQVINSPGSEFEFRCGWKFQLILTNRRLALLMDKSIYMIIIVIFIAIVLIRMIVT